MNPAAEREMSVGQAVERPYRLAPQRGPSAASALPRLTYTVAEVAEMLGCSRSTVYDLIGAGQLPAFALTKRKTVVRSRDLDAFLDSMGEV